MVRLQVCIQYRLDVIFGLLSSAVRRKNGFPAGTWWLHRFAGVKRADVGESAPPS
jgi:hypothetical protein